MFGPHLGYPLTGGIEGLGHAGRMMAGTGAKSGLGGFFSSLFGKNATAAAATGAIKQGINWGGLLTNTHKTLGVINQAIPIFYQVGPIFNNAKTMFRIANAVKDVDSSSNNQDSPSKNIPSQENVNNLKTEKNKPIFYL